MCKCACHFKFEAVALQHRLRMPTNPGLYFQMHMALLTSALQEANKGGWDGLGAGVGQWGGVGVGGVVGCIDSTARTL